MIFDSVENVDCYGGQSDAITKAVQFVMAFDPSQPDGKYPIEGENIFALVQSVETGSPDGKPFEAHQKFLDVHIVLDGQERQDVVLMNRAEAELVQDYSEQNDALLFRTDDFSTVILKPGMFALYGPSDGHRPCLCLNAPEKIRKVCVKIKLP